MMELQTSCPHCAKPLKLPQRLANNKVKCPHCQQLFSHRPNSSAESWYLHSYSGEQFGPVSKQELTGWVSQGLVTPSCQLLREGESQWIPATNIFPEIVGQTRVSDTNPYRSPPETGTIPSQLSPEQNQIMQRIARNAFASQIWGIISLVATVLFLASFCIGPAVGLLMFPVTFTGPFALWRARTVRKLVEQHNLGHQFLATAKAGESTGTWGTTISVGIVATVAILYGIMLIVHMMT